MRRWIGRIVAVRQVVVPQYPDGLVVFDPQTMPVAVQLGTLAPHYPRIHCNPNSALLPRSFVLDVKSRLVFRPPPHMPESALLFFHDTPSLGRTYLSTLRNDLSSETHPVAGPSCMD
jgi:hypothetical protein